MKDHEGADFTEATIDSRTVFRGKLLHVLDDAVRLPDGRSSAREYVRHPGAVMMLPLTGDGKVVLVRQYRYALKRHFIEIPAGKMEAGEDPLDTARRELREECGLEAASWQHLTTIHPCIGYSDERIEFYVARGLSESGSAPEDGEFIETFSARLDEALQWVRDGRITDVKSMIALLWAEKLLRGEWPAAAA
jgi:ADP-ribose pyrophosphatase